MIEAHLQAGSPAIGRAPKDLTIPDGCSLFAVIRGGVATPLHPDTVMLEGDKVIAIGRQECKGLLHDQLIGDKIQKVVKVLELARSTYFPAFQRLFQDVELARQEANDNVKFLKPLRK